MLREAESKNKLLSKMSKKKLVLPNDLNDLIERRNQDLSELSATNYNDKLN